MHTMKRMAALSLTAALSLAPTALAAEPGTGYADVAAGAWYAEAAAYCRDNGLMNGTGETAFSPDRLMTRAQLATILYRLAGSPETEITGEFRDVSAGSVLARGVYWARSAGITSGYTDTTFGPNDPVTRAQLAAFLWRYAQRPAAAAAAAFTDSASIPAWGADAAAWAQENGYIGGYSDGRFNPYGQATRAQTAAILMRYHRAMSGSAAPEEPAPEQPVPEQPAGADTDTLVAWFSATGTTAGVAERLAAVLDADTYEITPAQPYTAADLDYNTDGCRANQEQNDPAARPAISGSVDDMDEYEVIFLGYPIWWGEAPKIIYTFLESYDLEGKTIVPFCTSGSTGISGSLPELEALETGADWLEGRRFSGSASESELTAWVDGLGLPG